MKKEVAETYTEVLYEPEFWRKGEHLPTAQGLVLGSIEKAGKLYALVDTGDVHCLKVGKKDKESTKGILRVTGELWHGSPVAHAVKLTL